MPADALLGPHRRLEYPRQAPPYPLSTLCGRSCRLTASGAVAPKPTLISLAELGSNGVEYGPFADPTACGEVESPDWPFWRLAMRVERGGNHTRGVAEIMNVTPSTAGTTLRTLDVSQVIFCRLLDADGF